MALFEVPVRNNSRNQDSNILKKTSIKNTTTTKIKASGGISAQIESIKLMVDKHLGKYKESSELIRDKDRLHDYISHAIANGVIAIDTETTGLNPIEDKLVGVCIYTPGEKTAYIPMNHVSYITKDLVANQLDRDSVSTEIARLKDTVRIIMFNAAFDIRVIRHGLGVYLTCYWDCYLAARLLNENEGSGNNGLKALHQKYVLDGKEDEFSFGALFKGIPFSEIPIQTGYLYAAHDAIITYEFYKYQEQFLEYHSDETLDSRNGMNGVAWVFFNVEMPCVDVVCNMEDNGIELDTAYANTLSVKYHELKENKLNEIHSILDRYEQQIDAKRAMGAKLDNPLNIDSTTQLPILLYDILGLDAGVDKKTGKVIRSTGEEVLSRLDHPLCKLILEYRGINKLLSTYIDKLPLCVSSVDKRVHCKFNQYGADTGRFSSNDPNLQNIPSHNKDIRKMFKARDGYVLMSSDFSQQEPKCLAALCRQQGDSQMYDTFMQGKDLYSEIASKAFNYPYEECKEFRPDGTTNKEGKERRTQAKSILLGVLYGRGVESIAEQLHTTPEVASEIKESVFRGFPAIKKFEEDSLAMAKEVGYVTTVCGRKRRLPDLQLNRYDLKWMDGYVPEGDILDFDDVDDDIPDDVYDYYINKITHCKFKDRQRVLEEANKDHLWIIDNGAKIADATRQCVNSRIQGSAADLTKIAMIELNRSGRLKELGFSILIPVHDEIIAECPLENAKECSELLASTMSKAAERILEMPIKCDVEITRQWYGEVVNL